MTEVTFTFRLNAALKTAFTAMAEDQDLSAAHLLRRMMRDAVAEHQEAAAHERWRLREIGDAMHEADATHGLNLPNAVIEDDWEQRKKDMRGDAA